MKEFERKYIDKIDLHLITSLGKFEHGYVIYANSAKVFIAELIHEANAKLEALQAPKTCESCVYIGLNQCRLVREVEIVSGLCGDGYIEIDNPSTYFCADYEPKETNAK